MKTTNCEVCFLNLSDGKFSFSDFTFVPFYMLQVGRTNAFSKAKITNLLTCSQSRLKLPYFINTNEMRTACVLRQTEKEWIV